MRLALPAAAVVLALAPLGAQTPTFSARLDAVRVDVLVTDRQGFVRGLQPADFEVLDNGVPQQVDFASFEALPLNVVAAFDMSESISGERLGHLREAERALLDGLKSSDRAALLTFSHKLTLLEDLTSDVRRPRDAMDEATPRGQTSLVDATHAAMLVAEPRAGRNLVILFSDGLDTASWLPPGSVIDSARRADLTVYAVAVRENGRSEFLEKLAEATGGAVVEIESTRDLSRTLVAILDEFRQRYVVSFSPRGVARPGWHTLQVRVKGRQTTVKARSGYFAGGN
jgi:VWFA-related protein